MQPTALAPALLSKLLWAAWGINREHGAFGETGALPLRRATRRKSTFMCCWKAAPTYTTRRANRLEGVLDEDIRSFALTPGQRGVNARAPAQLVFVADVERLIHTRELQEPGLQNPETQKSYFFVDAGLIAANVYLFAAAERLAAWFHNCTRRAWRKNSGFAPNKGRCLRSRVGYRGAATERLTDLALRI